MIVEALLPSEIARLVYWYLVEEKCTEAAKTFLNESPNLYEFRVVLQRGRIIPRNVNGHALLDYLETFCLINNIVQDKLAVFDSTHSIRKCNNIVTQIKYLLEESRSSQAANSRNELVQSINATASVTPSKTYKKRHSGSNDNGSVVATQSDDGYQTETPPDSNSNIPSVEATPLEHLPGYIESLQYKKCQTSQSTTVKTPTKIPNKFTHSQQIKQNVSQAIQTSIKDAEIHKIRQASKTEKKVQSQEVQTSLVSEADESLAPKLITNSIQKVQTENHKTSEENVNKLNTGTSVTHVKDKQSKFCNPKTNLCNNLGSSGSNQEVINLDDSGDQSSLESPQKNDPGIKVSEECIEISEDSNQSSPEVDNTDSMNITPVIETVPPAKLSGTTNEGTSSQDTIVLDSVCNETNLAKQTIQTAPNNIPNNTEVQEKRSVNSTEPSLFDKNFPNPPEFSDHNTSTPLKLYTATQNYDNNEWFSTETLPSSNIVPTKETAAPVINGFSFAQTATENIVGPVDGFISPIISKENTKVAEKISLNCSVANPKKDDTLHTPDVPPVTKSFIPTMLAPIAPISNVQPKNKTPVLPKNTDGENVPPNVQTSPSFVSISSLVKNTEFNRYFSIDSISVTQMDNTSNTVQNPTIVPEIQVEDSVGSVGTGLSPFLKINKKSEENVVIQKNENNNTANDEVEDTQALLNVKLAETNVKAIETELKNTLDANVNGSDCIMNEIQEVALKPAIDPPAHDIAPQAAVTEAKETLEVVTIDETDNNEVDMNEEVVSTTEIVHINTEESIDPTLKDVSNKADIKTNSKVEDDLEQMLRTVVGETDEINECRKENDVAMTSNNHDQTDATAKNGPILNQAVNAQHIEPKAPVESGKKVSLKSFICQTFEPYIDKNKDNSSSNHNTEVPTKNTPKPVVEERAKTQRRSLSTPKKPNSHIRALNFETPFQSRSDSKINEKTRCASPETAKKNLKKMHESFQSPPVVHCDTDNQVQDGEEPSIAVNGNEKMDAEKMSDVVAQSSQEKELKKENAKKSWDSDLRMLCQASEQPKVEAPKRKYKTKSKEEGSAKKKKRDKSKTPHKEKKSPHSKKSKKSEKEKTPKKSKKHDKSSEHKEHKSKDSKNSKTKTEDELSAKDCKDLGAQIESNLFLDNTDEVKKKVGDKLSHKECKDISAQVESNVLSSKNKAEEKSSAKEKKNISGKIENNLMAGKNKNIKKNDKAKVMSDESNILSNNENKVKDGDGKKVQNNKETSKVDQKLDKVDTKLSEQKVAINNMNLNSNQRVITEFKKTEVVTQVQEIPTQPESKDLLSIILKPSKKKDPLEYLLSDSINDDEAFNDMMEMDSDDIIYHKELTKDPIDKEIAEKMVQDEQAIAAVLEEANHAINEKYKSNEVITQQDFFPETSLMTDGDESEEEDEQKNKNQEEIMPLKDNEIPVVEKIVEVTDVRPDNENNKSSQDIEKQAKPAQTSEKTPETSSKPAVDYDSIEKQLSIITNTEVPSARKVVYDQVHKVEGGKVVSKKYARLKTIDTKLATRNKIAPLGGYEIELNSSSVQGDDSMEMPPTPQIVDPGSNSWVPNPLVKEDSRTIHSSIPTPLECPPTPKIFLTPQKVEEPVKVVSQKVETVPFYHLTPITFETVKKPEVTEFKVVKEVLKKTTPKTPSEKVEEESKTSAKTPKSVNSSYKDESSSRFDSEDSDSSSSSDSSDSSSSSSDDDDDSSMQAPVFTKAKEDAVETKPKTEEKLQHIIESEEVVAGNEIIVIEREKVVMTQESSPAKVFKIHKTDKELEETVKETPAKDENMIPEEGIFETPNVSKPVENPTNLHTKISQMMILKEQEESKRLEVQQKPKIINNVRLSPKLDMKNYAPQVKPLSAPNEQIKTMIVEKSEAEVAMAIESIANEKFGASQDELNASNASTIPPEVQPTDQVKKRELTKAIQSIIKEDKDEESSGSSSDDDSSSDGEPNLELILEDDVKSPPQGFNAEAVTDESSLEFENTEGLHAEFHIVFDEAKHKKRRRTEIFTDGQMSFEPQDEDGNVFATIAPTCVDILFNLIPPKKKVIPKKKIKEEIKEEEEEEIDDGDSSEDFVPAKNTRGGTKRKRLNDQATSRKRKKNIFIY